MNENIRLVASPWKLSASLGPPIGFAALMMMPLVAWGRGPLMLAITWLVAIVHGVLIVGRARDLWRWRSRAVLEFGSSDMAYHHPREPPQRREVASYSSVESVQVFPRDSGIILGLADGQSFEWVLWALSRSDWKEAVAQIRARCVQVPSA